MKIRPVGAELLHADRRTDITKLTVAFHSFANAPKNSYTWNNTQNGEYFSLKFESWAMAIAVDSRGEVPGRKGL